MLPLLREDQDSQKGKTSTVEFMRQIWKRVTWDSASIGTLGMQGIESRDMQGTMMGLAVLTTPDALRLHPALHQLAGAGITHLASVVQQLHDTAQHMHNCGVI